MLQNRWPFESSFLAENWHKKFQHNKRFSFFLNLDPKSIWFNLIMSGALCHQYQFGLRSFEDCGDKRKREIKSFYLQWIIGARGQKYEMWYTLVFSRIMYAHNSIWVHGFAGLPSHVIWEFYFILFYYLCCYSSPHFSSCAPSTQPTPYFHG